MDQTLLNGAASGILLITAMLGTHTAWADAGCSTCDAHNDSCPGTFSVLKALFDRTAHQKSSLELLVRHIPGCVAEAIRLSLH